MSWSKKAVERLSRVEIEIRDIVEMIGPENPGVTEIVQANELLFLGQQAGMEHLRTARSFVETLKREACDHSWDGPRIGINDCASVATCSKCGASALEDEQPEGAANSVPRKTNQSSHDLTGNEIEASL